jgi:hypothetical protein
VGYCCDCGQEFSTGGEKGRPTAATQPESSSSQQQQQPSSNNQTGSNNTGAARIIVAPVDQENSSMCNESAEETDTSKNNTPIPINRRQHVVHVGLSSDGLLLDDHENVTLL